MGKRRPILTPSQTRLSVQDVRDYTTPQGAAMANEEMRRLRFAVDRLSLDPNKKGGDDGSGGGGSTSSSGGGNGGDGGGNGNGIGLGWALTISIIGDKTQGFASPAKANQEQIVPEPTEHQWLRFKNNRIYSKTKPVGRLPVYFDIEKTELPNKKYGTFPEADASLINAYVDIDVYGLLSMYYGRMSITSYDDSTRRFDNWGLPYNGLLPGRAFTLVNDEEEPAPFHYYGTDAEGIKGFHPLPGATTGYLKRTFTAYEFSVGDTLVGSLGSPAIIDRAIVEIVEPFDAELFVLGTTSSPSILHTENDIRPSAAGKYATMTDYEFISESPSGTVSFHIKCLSSPLPTVGIMTVIIYFN